jgi:hypothetical protein
VIGVAGALSTRRFQGIEGGQLSVLVAERRMDERGRTKGPQPALLPLMSQAPGQAACAGMSDVFDSTERQVADQARRVCDRCPVRDWCASEARHAVKARLPISGTWAGAVYSDGTAQGTGVVDD